MKIIFLISLYRKDISLPESLERSLASEAEALREARAKIISAEGELNASKALKEASDIMAKNKITLQVNKSNKYIYFGEVSDSQRNNHKQFLEYMANFITFAKQC